MARDRKHKRKAAPKRRTVSKRAPANKRFAQRVIANKRLALMLDGWSPATVRRLFDVESL